MFSKENQCILQRIISVSAIHCNYQLVSYQLIILVPIYCLISFVDAKFKFKKSVFICVFLDKESVFSAMLNYCRCFSSCCF
jgi:hypothetical protein